MEKISMIAIGVLLILIVLEYFQIRKLRKQTIATIERIAKKVYKK